MSPRTPRAKTHGRRTGQPRSSASTPATPASWWRPAPPAPGTKNSTVFAFDGIGRFLAQAVFARDFPVIQAGILFLAVIFVVVNLLVDLSYGLLDPRVRTR